MKPRLLYPNRPWKVTEGDWRWLHTTFYWWFVVYVYLVSFLRYSTSNNDVPFKSGLRIIQGHRKQHHSIGDARLRISPPL